MLQKDHRSQAASPGDGCPLEQQVNDQFSVVTGEGRHLLKPEVRKKYMGAESVGLREMVVTMRQIGQNSDKKNEQKDNEKYFLHVWVL